MQQQKQNQNMIQNPVMTNQQQSQSPEINDRDILNEGLNTCKMLTDNYNVMAREASHKELYNDVISILNETHKSAREAFNLMFEQGHYKLEAVDAQKIQQARQQFQGYAQSQLPNVQQNIMQ